MFGRAWPLIAPVRPGRVPSWQELGISVPCTVSIRAAPFLYLSLVICKNDSCCANFYTCLLNLQNDEVATAWLNNDSVRSTIHAEPV
jgi:serine carboxypeptidase-like clade 1